MATILLPVGSVVKLHNIDQPILIYGTYQMSLQNGKTYDYLGTAYPAGFLGGESNVLFQANAITEVLFEGYKTPAYESLMTAAAARMAAQSQEAATAEDTEDTWQELPD